MAIDEVKIESLAKALSLIVLSAYLAWQVAITVRAPPGTGNADAFSKANLIRPTCLLVLGGSNARNAFSAVRLSTDGCPALNLAVSTELGNFDRYMAWLGGRARADTVIYSTMLVLSPSPPSDDDLLSAADHVTPIAGRLKVMLLGPADNPSSAFTSEGDQLQYVCNSAFRGQYLEFSDLERRTPEVVAELVRRVQAIRQVTGARRVVLHTPRVYIDDHLNQVSRDGKSRFLKALGSRLAAIRGAGIAVMDTPVVYSDKSLFCNDSHANAKGRDRITEEVRRALSEK